MAKKALFDVLEKTIGKYVCNLDTNSLNVAIWSGKIELHALELNVAAVNAEIDRQATQAPNLALPLRVVDGRFSSFEVDVPWTHLMSKPVILRAKGLQVSMAPVDAHTFEEIAKTTEAKAADRVHDARQQSIATANDYRLQTNALTKLAEEDLDNSGKGSNDTGFVARLARRIIENLQIEISDVQVTLQGAEASAGVVLKSLRLTTIDENGKQTFVDRTSKSENTFLHKSLVLQGLGAYLDEKDATKSQPLAAIGEDADSSGDEDEVNGHSYILAPLSFTAKLRQADGNVCIDYPKYLLESELAALTILLSKTQVDLARKIHKQIKPAIDAPRPLFPEYRPVNRVNKENAREWWRYAYRCVGRLNGRRSWVEFFRAFQLRNEYIYLYKRNAHKTECSWMQDLSKKEMERLNEIEEDRSISIDGIMTWRNIADARAKKEIEKKDSRKAKPSLFGSLFTKSDAKKSGEDDPPISLSPDELKELETLTLKDVGADGGELSKDSKLCDLSFVLKALTVHLTSNDMRPLSTLNMGKVSTTWKANADGSFVYDLSLLSLVIEDRVTPHTLFPNILSNQHRDDVGKDQAFVMRLEKTRKGDQRLAIKLQPFELVASPILVQELSKFSSSKNLSGPPKDLKDAHPVLRQSMTGSVDLFYDASEGVDLSSPPEKPARHAAVPKPTTDFSAALFDAWKAKTESNALWILDLDLSAPVIVVPESCSRPHANVLVLNLGRLKFRYGDIQSAFRVKKWFANHPYPDKTVDAQYDYGALEVSSLTFVVGRAEHWKELTVPQSAESAPQLIDPVLAPITATMDVGIESHSTKARMAAFLVLPLISGRLSPNLVARILTVSKAWQKIAASMSNTVESFDRKDEDTLSHVTTGSASSQRLSLVAKRANELLLSTEDSDNPKLPLIHFDVTLKRLSAELSVEGGHGVEAHLVSVSSSATTYSDGCVTLRLSMGWFWVLDRLDGAFTRTQRLIAHSSLLHPADYYSGQRDYNIFEELKLQGVFNDEFEGSADLADVVVRHSPRAKFGKSDPFKMHSSMDKDDFAVDTLIDANFTSMYVNWNPYAVKALVSGLDGFKALIASEAESERGSIILAGAEPNRARVPDSAAGNEDSCILVRARLDRLELILRSAIDDLPLFSLSMTETKAAIALAGGERSGVKADISVGNLKAVSSALGHTCSSYQTLLGVSPGQSESLLTVSYHDGPRAMQHVEDRGGQFESYGLIQLSSMRMVYIQSQTLALVNYSTEGILGALTKQAASTAAAAAADMASAGTGKKLFVVRASGIEVVVPEAAYVERAMSVHTRELTVQYTALPHPGGGEAKIALTGLMLSGSRKENLLSKPNELQVSVSLPPEGVGSADDQAMRVFVNMGGADLAITKSQYEGVLSLVSKNIGDTNLYLRPTEMASEEETVSQAENVNPKSTLTHAGSMMIENPRRIYTSIVLAGFSLSLFGSDHDNPLIRLTTDETRINADLYPNGEKLSTTVSMKNLECSDVRIKSVGREYRSLVYQEKSGATAPTDLILVEYETKDGRDTAIKISVGTPHIVFIPDAVSDALHFFETRQGVATPSDSSSVENSPRAAVTTSGVEIKEANSGVEAMYIVGNEKQEELSNFSLSCVTSECCFIFVDLGSATLMESVKLDSNMVLTATETFVVKGILDFRANVVTDSSNEMVSAGAEFHGDGVEAYTAFGGSDDALQVLEPIRLSLYAHTRMVEDRLCSIDVRVASVNPVDLCMSMKNVALLSAIVAGISDCFDDSTDDEPPSIELTQKEAEHIEKLGKFLQNDEELAALEMSRASSFADAVGTTAQLRSRISAKFTLPELKFVVINDLQGLDEALFRVAVQNLVANGSVETGVKDHRMKEPFTTFTGNLNCSIVSDYFDESSRSWKQLLLRPWEITLRTQRAMNSRLSARIPSTTCDIESFACQMGFTEQFLMNLAAANHMWAIYSTATSAALQTAPEDMQTERLRRAVAASAARTLVTVLPYVIENHCGRDILFTVHGGRATRSTCSNSTMEYFRFPQPRGGGFGGKRSYGQDRTSKNSLTIFIDEHAIHLPDVDSMVSGDRASHVLPTQEVVFVRVIREGKTNAIHVSSSVDIVNKCSIPFNVSVITSKPLSRKPTSAGFVGKSVSRHQNANNARRSFVRRDGRMTKPSGWLGVPIGSLSAFHADWASFQKCKLDLSLSPEQQGDDDDGKLVGSVEIVLQRLMFRSNSVITSSFDVTCRSTSDADGRHDSFVARVDVVATLVRGLPHIEMTISPRMLIQNILPLSISMRTPMPHTISETFVQGRREEFDVHHLAPGDNIEIFTPGPSIAISLRCTDSPVAGNPTDWMEGGWIDLPLTSEFRLAEPYFIYLPFPSGTLNTPSPHRGGTEVVIAQRLSSSWDLQKDDSSEAIEVSAASDSDEWRKYMIGISHYAVDHTGEVLFEDSESSSIRNASVVRSSQYASSYSQGGHSTLAPLGAYRSERHHGRITMLPLGKKSIRMLHLTMEGESGYSISAPFIADDIAICEGGVEATNIPWESGEPSGFYAYRRLINSFQSEIHIIPEYVIWNGSSTHTIRVKQPGRGEVTVPPRKIAPLRSDPKTRLAISIEYEGFGGRTAPMNVDTAALRFAVVRLPGGNPIGSVAIETVVGAQDSRWVVKLSDLKLGAAQVHTPRKHSMIEHDLIRFRIQWTELRVMLSETSNSGGASSLEPTENPHMAKPRSQMIASSLKNQGGLVSSTNTRHLEPEAGIQVLKSTPVCTVLFYRFTVDFQRVFKEEQGTTSRQSIGRAKASPERSQISFIVHNVQLLDETDGVKYPIVFDSTTDASFFDLVIRTRGPLSAEMINVNLVDLKLSYTDGKTRPVVIRLSEDFIWKLLDLSNRISDAASEFAGQQLTLSYDKEHEGFIVSVSDQKASFIEDESKYTPPNSTTLYDFERIQVSPVLFNVSFDRTPQKSRYAKKKHIRGAHVLNYFTRQLKFKIDEAELRFATFQAANIKGGSDRLVELLSTAYVSRLKFKIVNLLAASSFLDWKNIASRQEGDDEFLEGDIMRVTGNLAGRSANYILKKAGYGLGAGIRKATGTVGDGFETAASAVGARALGSGVNNVVSGVGQGVGDTLTGLGSGAGKVLKGTGQGIGQVFGGLTGGATHLEKESERDYKAMARGFAVAWPQV